VDISYASGNNLFGQTVQFSVGTHDWEYRDAIIQLNETVDSIRLTALFREHTGSVWFDDFFFWVVKSSSVPKKGEEEDFHSNVDVFNCLSGVFGATHVAQHNGEVLDIPSPGEYTLLREKTNREDFEVQFRTVPFGAGSLVSAVAIKLKQHTVSVQLDVPPSGWNMSALFPKNGKFDEAKVYVDFFPVTWSNDSITIPGEGIITRRPSINHVPYDGNLREMNTSQTFLLEFNSGRILIFQNRLRNYPAYFLHAIVEISSELGQNMTGMADQCTNKAVPLRARQTSEQTASNSARTCQGTNGLCEWANSWQVEAGKSWFFPEGDSPVDWQPNAGKSCDSICHTYNDKLRILFDSEQGKEIHSSTDFAGASNSQLVFFSAVGLCDEDDLTTLNHSCIVDLLLTACVPVDGVSVDSLACINGSLTQNYRKLEGELHLISEALQLIQGNQHQLYTQQEDDDESYSYTTWFLWGSGALIATGLIIAIYRYRKKKTLAANSGPTLPTRRVKEEGPIEYELAPLDEEEEQRSDKVEEFS